MPPPRLPLLLLLCLIPSLAERSARHIAAYEGRGPVVGQTPCCTDRLTTLICLRQKQVDPALFLHKCMRNVDYAFLQCCQTCFDQKADDAYHLDYKKTSEFLLTDPDTAQCYDRRGQGWCHFFAQRKLNWTVPMRSRFAVKRRMDCSNVPIAFRLCRETCGFCATRDVPSHAVYDYAQASDAYKCYNPAQGLAQRKTDMRAIYRDFASRFTAAKDQRRRPNKGKTRKPRPHANRASTEQPHAPDDYFVVADHPYAAAADE